MVETEGTSFASYIFFDLCSMALTFVTCIYVAEYYNRVFPDQLLLD